MVCRRAFDERVPSGAICAVTLDAARHIQAGGGGLISTATFAPFAPASSRRPSTAIPASDTRLPLAVVLAGTKSLGAAAVLRLGGGEPKGAARRTYAAAASGTIEAEDGGLTPHRPSVPTDPVRSVAPFWLGPPRARWAGAPSAEPA
jgi:hypothetical protein